MISWEHGVLHTRPFSGDCRADVRIGWTEPASAQQENRVFAGDRRRQGPGCLPLPLELRPSAQMGRVGFREYRRHRPPEIRSTMTADGRC